MDIIKPNNILAQKEQKHKGHMTHNAKSDKADHITKKKETYRLRDAQSKK